MVAARKLEHSSTTRRYSRQRAALKQRNFIIAQRRDVCDIAQGAGQGMDGTGIGIYTDVRPHAEVRQLAVLGLMHYITNRKPVAPRTRAR